MVIKKKKHPKFIWKPKVSIGELLPKEKQIEDNPSYQVIDDKRGLQDDDASNMRDEEENISLAP